MIISSSKATPSEITRTINTLKKMNLEQINDSLLLTNTTSLLMLDVKANNIEIVKFLIEKGAQVNTIDSDGASPLEVASNKQHQEIAHLILKALDPKKQKSKDIILHALTLFKQASISNKRESIDSLIEFSQNNKWNIKIPNEDILKYLMKIY